MAAVGKAAALRKRLGKFGEQVGQNGSVNQPELTRFYLGKARSIDNASAAGLEKFRVTGRVFAASEFFGYFTRFGAGFGADKVHKRRFSDA